MSDWWIAIALGVVEGVTEFLPISSTGHLVLCQKWFGVDLEHDPFWKMFAVFIQIGAIAAVVVYFRQRLGDLLRGQTSVEPVADRTKGTAGEPEAPDATVAPTPGEPASAGGPAAHTALLEPTVHSAATTTTTIQAATPLARGVAPHRNHALWMIIVASLPLVIAYLAHRWAEQNLESVMVVAAALGIGGVLMILIDRFRPPPTTARIEHMNWRQALGIGLAQIVAALFPGTSRSMATILGGELAGLTRPAAAEFSFFLAIPAMAAACTFSLVKHRTSLDARHILLLAIGTVVSFLVAWMVIAAFMSFIRRHSFVPFAIYRIILAIVVLAAFR